MPTGKLHTTDNLLICTACGAQYDVALPDEHPRNTPTLSSLSSSDAAAAAAEPIPADELPLNLQRCRICDDPREYILPTGQTFTTLGRMHAATTTTTTAKTPEKKYKNIFRTRKENSKVIELWTEPKFAIGQRACIIQTPHGNVMWDMIAYLDRDTVDKINELGGLEFIIISHPHFYTTWLDWAKTFQCPVYMAKVDANSWANRTASTTNTTIITSNPSSTAASDTSSGLTDSLRLLTNTHTELLPGLTAIVAGGHFPGSMLLHSQPPNTNVPTMFAADTIMAVPSAHNPDLRYFQPGAGIVSYTFLWSIPNMIPLDPDAVLRIWNAIKDPKFEFRSSYAVYAGEVVRALDGETGLRARVLESMKVFVRRSGWTNHVLLNEELP